MIRTLAIASLLAACSHPSPPPRSTSEPGPHADAHAEPPSAKVGVALDVTPADANVIIDGESHGEAGKLPKVLELKPGLYTLVIERAGYNSYRVEFSVADKVESFSVHLEPAKK